MHECDVTATNIISEGDLELKFIPKKITCHMPDAIYVHVYFHYIHITFIPNIMCVVVDSAHSLIRRLY